MTEPTRMLPAIEQGNAQTAEQLLPLVYDELRRLAARKLARERPGQTLQPTALVHEAYLRLIDPNPTQYWDSPGHFFAAAAEAMRRILVDDARRKRSRKRGGLLIRHELDRQQPADSNRDIDLLALDEALDRLAERDADAAALVKLRYFAGMTLPEAAKILGASERTAERIWTYARSFLFKELRARDGG